MLRFLNSTRYAGTAFYYFAVISPDGGIAALSVDGNVVASIDVSTGAGSNTNANPNISSHPDVVDTTPQLLFAQHGLDGSNSHTWKLADKDEGASGRPYITFYQLM